MNTLVIETPDQHKYWRNTRQDKANIRLITAAPDLLRALENLVTAVTLFAHNPDGWDELKQAQAAIAKAKGDRIK